MRKLIEKIIMRFKMWRCSMKPICPDCNGFLEAEMLDMKFDKLVYKCTVCGKEWV